VCNGRTIGWFRVLLVSIGLMSPIAIQAAGSMEAPASLDWTLSVAAREQGILAPAPANSGSVTGLRLWPDSVPARNALAMTGAALVVGTYGLTKWWNDGFTRRFDTENEGWFGQTTAHGGADKLGHAMFSYASTRLLTRGFETMGNESGQAIKLGFWSALGLMTAVEIADGYSRQHRFSSQDAVMNLIGAGMGYLMERRPDLDQLVDLRLLYRKSAQSNFDPAGDYSGQTYLLALKASGVPRLREHGLSRYLEFAVGYGARNFDLRGSGVEPNRNVYVGISLNVSEVLRQTAFRGAASRGRTQRAAEMFLEYIQLPGTAALARERL